MAFCKICGEPNCKKHSALIFKSKKVKEFSGSSPPEVFVGQWNYPNVYTGILSPDEHGDTTKMSSAEKWQSEKTPIKDVLAMRNKLIYSRTSTNIHKAKSPTRLLSTMHEVAMTHKSISAEYFLKKPVTINKERETRVPLISKAAQIEKVELQENPSINKKVEYLVSDNEVKSSHALIEMEKSGIETSSMIKILSAGLLGLKKNRILVPTRWSITAVDDTLSKNKLKKIKLFQEISDFQVFHAEYVGNHYEFLLLPDKFSFEVIEISLKSEGVWQDHETFFERKKYADSVTGAYYSNRLALTEYLEKIKRQATCLVFREIRPEYYAPLGVGILRETSREAFSKTPEKFPSLEEALKQIQTRLKQSVTNYTSKSKLLKNFGKQKKITEFMVRNQ